MPGLRSTAIDILKKHPALRLQVRKGLEHYHRFNYKRTTGKLPLDEKKVLFETFTGRQYGCNPKAIYEEMCRDPKFDDWTLVWSFKEPEDYADLPELGRAKLVRFKTPEYFRDFGTAKYVITNSMVYGGITRKEGQTIFQTWHGTPLKRLRCDIAAEKGNVNNTLEEIRIRHDRDTVRYTHFLSPSAWASERFMTAFNLRGLGMADIITEVGYPRNDLLTNYTQADIDHVHDSLGIPRGKKVILYAPTFRDNNHKSGDGYQYDMRLDFDKLQQELGDEYIILFRTHYFIANTFDFSKYEGFIYNMAQLDDITNLYLVTDILVTDYSSVFFDFAVLKRPMIFYMYDLEEYANDIRGFYLDIDELPGDIVKTQDDLIRSIKKAGRGDFRYDEKYEAFNRKFNYLDDGKAARRVIDEVFE